MIIKLKINSISCTPSYMFKIKEKCEEMKINPKELGLKKGFLVVKIYFKFQIFVRE